jgi:hypothetical protein
MDGFLRTSESVWTMSQSKVHLPPGEILKDGSVAVVEGEPDKPPIPAGFTLRVKPDRRREQLPIPAELDRRRPRTSLSD